MNFKIRQCEISDTKAIYDLNVCEMGYDYKEEKTKEKLKELLESDKDKILVALIDNIIVGYVHRSEERRVG